LRLIFLTAQHRSMLLCRFECHAVEARSDCVGMFGEELRDLVCFHKHSPSLMRAVMDNEWMHVSDFHLMHEINVRREGGFVVWIASKEASDRFRHFVFHLLRLGSSGASSPHLTIILCSRSRLRIALCSSS